MNITSKLKIDLQSNSGSDWISAMQEDINTRCAEILLYSGSEPWEIPAETTAAVGFQKPDGTGGLYDRLPDGTDAVTLSGNTVSMILVPQMLTAPGLVRAVVTLYDAKRNQLSTFPFHIQVEENPAAGKVVSENYCYCTSVADINEALNAALSTMEQTVASVETALESGALNGKSAYDYARDGGYTDTEEAFSQMLAAGMADEAAIEKAVADYLEENPPASGGSGGTGATFTPAVDASGNLSWSNDAGLSNPPTVNIKGPKGDPGDPGPQGEKGEAGDPGPQGPQGEKGEDGTGITILGSYESAEALDTAHPVGNIGESYLVAGHLFVWSQSDSGWVNVGNIQGPQGETGEKGDTGPQGPQGEKGDPGVSGSDGMSATHSWNGTVLTITSSSGTSSADLKGDPGTDGAKGDKGDTGAAGYSPVRGTDYWTDEDIAQIKSYVDEAILGGAW